MAKNEAKIKFTADTSAFTQQIKSANSTLSELRSELKLNEASFKNSGDKAEYFTNKQKLLESALEANRAKQEALNEKLEAAKRIYGENSEEVNSWKQKLVNAKTEEQNLEAQLKETTDALDDQGQAAEDSASKAESAATGGWTTMKGVISDLASEAIQSAIQALENLAQDVMETGTTFETSMSNVQALSGASAEEMELLESTAREYGSTTKYSASEAADALGYMALAGWDAQTSADNLGGVLQLASASGMELAEASDMVTDYLSAFSNTAMTSTDMANMLAYAQGNSNTSAEQLGEAYKNCAANVNAAGQDFQTTTALLEAMANQGLKGGEAGTALNAIMRDITSNMEDGAISIGDATVSVTNADGSFRDLTDIMKDVESATDGMTDAQKATALQSTFTSDSTKGLNLILNEGVDNIAGYEEELRNCDGTAADMADTMTDNLGGDMANMNSAFEEFQLQIYDDVQEPMREVVQSITSEVIPAAENVWDHLTEIGTWMSEHQGVMQTIAIIVGSIAAAILIYNTYQAIATALTAAKAAADAAGAVSLAAYAAAQAAALLPVIAIVAAIAAVIAIIVLCITHWDQIKAKVIEVATAMKAKIDEAFGAIKEKVASVIESVKGKIEEFKTKIDTIKQKVSDMASNVKEKFDDVKEKVKSAIDAVKGFLSGELTFPHIKVPHFKISGGVLPWGIGGQGTAPSVSVSWYAKGAVFKEATILATNGGLKGVGEAGPEAVAPISVLQGYVSDAVSNSPLGIDYETLADLIAAAVQKTPVSIVMNSREVGRVEREAW